VEAEGRQSEEVNSFVLVLKPKKRILMLLSSASPAVKKVFLFLFSDFLV